MISCIQHAHDWYNVTRSQFKMHGGSGLLHHFKGSIVAALQTAYPKHAWQTWRFSLSHNIVGQSKASKIQHLLFQYVKSVSNDHTRVITARYYQVTM